MGSKTLPITAILAGLAVKAAAHAQKVLVNGWQALRRPSTEVPVAGAEHDCSVSLGQWRCSERGGPDPIDTAPWHLSDRTANDRGTRTWPPVTGSRLTAWEIARPTKESAKRRKTTLDLETAAAATHIQPTISVFRSK